MLTGVELTETQMKYICDRFIFDENGPQLGNGVLNFNEVKTFFT